MRKNVLDLKYVFIFSLYHLIENQNSLWYIEKYVPDALWNACKSPRTVPIIIAQFKKLQYLDECW
jgi:hypothetical protein